MSIKRYAGHTLKLLGGVPLTFQQLTQRTLNPKPTVIYNMGSGQFSPSLAAVAQVEPEFAFDSTELASLLTAVPITTGLGIVSTGTYTGAEIYHEGKADLGGRVGASLSYKNAMSKAMMFLRQVSAEHKQEAKISGTLLALSTDGTTAPLTNTDLVTAPAQAATEKFTLGPVKLNGSTINSVESVTIDFGLEVVASGEAGEPYPKFATIAKLEPKITIRTTDVTLFSSFPPSGTALTTGGIIYFRKFQTSGVVYADGSAQHVKFSIPNNQGFAQPGNITGSMANDETFEIVVMPLAGASALLAVTPASTIT